MKYRKNYKLLYVKLKSAVYFYMIEGKQCNMVLKNTDLGVSNSGFKSQLCHRHAVTRVGAIVSEASASTSAEQNRVYAPSGVLEA